MIKRAQIACVAAALLLAAPLPSAAKSPRGHGIVPHETSARLTALLERHIAQTQGVVGEAMAVIGPGARWEWRGAAGFASKAGEPLTVQHVFRVASVTKPFTAAAILRLMEDGHIDIDGPIAPLIAPETASALRGGGYAPESITVRELLAHTSGLYDYAEDPAFAEKVQADPGYRWSRAEQIAFAMRSGKPYGKPGERYAYSDTGYVILGEIIERVTAMPLGPAVRKLLDYGRIGLRDTYWERFEKPGGPTQPYAHAFYGAQDMGSVDPSFDLYGGGGLISSVSDLALFYRALVRGEVFHDRRTLAVMMGVTEAARGPDPAVSTERVDLLNSGPHGCWGHAGFWGTFAAYCPTRDVAFAWTMNQAEGADPAFSRFKELLTEALGQVRTQP